MASDYDRLCRALASRRLPAAVVDLDALDRNIDALLTPVRRHQKKLRLASKSVRCLHLLNYIKERGRDCIEGVMAYSATEAAFLVENGWRDVLLAYPTAHPEDANRLALLQTQGTVSVVVDDTDQIEVLQNAAKAASTDIPLIIELDVSWRPFGGRAHVGVRRSPLHTVDDVVALAMQIRDRPGIKFHGVMAYEAQIAGVTDQNPFSPILNAPKRGIKHISRRDLESKRTRLVAALKKCNLSCEVFNGGGTGSLQWCTKESALTEVTAGSGFLLGHLFDYYRDLDLEPAAFFSLQVVRRPNANTITCHGGGFVASGEAGPDRLPVPWLPEGLSLTKLEGAGEVQTPLTGNNTREIPLGAAVFFRHAKAGELAEHFNSYVLVRGEDVEAEVPTYRGEGHCFL